MGVACNKYYVKLVVEYYGRNFCGWQSQSGQRTVQGVIHESLLVFFRSEALKFGLNFESSMLPHIQGSGRTDSGVHALSQVVSFEWPTELLGIAKNILPTRLAAAIEGIAKHAFLIKSIEYFDCPFNARFTPHIKCYQYFFRIGSHKTDRKCDARLSGLYSDRAWSIGNVDISSMVLVARDFLGIHNFSAFRASDCQAKSTARTIHVSELARIDNDILVYSICGNGFLKQMVRIIAGTLVEIGRGGLSRDAIRNALQSGNRNDVGRTAPAHGLVLSWVKYEPLHKV